MLFVCLFIICLLGQTAHKKVKQSQPINFNSVKRKTAVVVPPRLQKQQIRPEYPDKQTVESDSSSSTQSDCGMCYCLSCHLSLFIEFLFRKLC